MLYPTKFLVRQSTPTVTSSQGEGLRALALLAAVSLLFGLGRGLFTGVWWFLILGAWNLFLALFPLGIMLVLRDLRAAPGLLTGIRLKLVTYSLVGLWLLFMPNGPYIITDLFHLRYSDNAYVYYDTMLIFVGALTGLLAGLYSTLLAHRLFNTLTNGLTAWGLVLACQALAGFGIFLGRFGRWNSWHLVSEPIGLSRALWDALQDPMAQKVTITYGFGLAVLYVAFLLFTESRVSTSPAPYVPMIDFPKVLRSFRFAGQGVIDLFRYENNAKVHVMVALVVAALGVWMGLSPTEWALICTQIGLVWAAEGFNTALEKLCDRVTTDHDPLIRAAKDLASGAVLILCIVAVVVGLLVFGPKLVGMYNVK